MAQELSNRLQNRFQIDSILCMDDTSAVGACLARKLTQHGGRSLSEGDDMYIIKGELDGKGNLIFRDNARFMLEGLPVISIFDTSVLKDYASHSPSECPMCKAGQPIDAVVNTFGFSKI